MFFTVDGGSRWTQLRENDVVMATFGNGFWILDDYSALREVSVKALAEDVQLFPLRHVYQFQPWGVANAGAAGVATLGGNYTTRNPPNGAVFTYHVRETLPEGTELVLTIRNTQGNQVRQMALNKTAGLWRVEWDLRGDPPQPAAEASRVMAARLRPPSARAAGGTWRSAGRFGPLFGPAWPEEGGHGHQRRAGSKFPGKAAAAAELHPVQIASRGIDAGTGNHPVPILFLGGGQATQPRN